MKILYFYQYFTTPKGAWSTRAYEFARRWAAAGDEVTVVTSVYYKSDIQPDRFVTERTVDGIRLKILNIGVSNKQPLWQQAWTFLQYAAVSTWFALTEKADVILASSGPITVAIPALAARYFRRRPFVFEVRDLWPEGAIQLGLLRNRLLIAALRALEKFCYRSAAMTVALSPGMADWIRRRYGIRNVEVVTNASDCELAERVARNGFELPDWARGKKLAVYAGSLGLMYGADQLLAVAAEMERSGGGDVCLAVIGTGSEQQRLAREAARQGLGNIRFLGQKSREEVFAWASRSLCLLSVVRPLEFFDLASPNKLFDALAAGVPLVQDTQGWMKDLLEREQCGITVPRGDVRAMAEAVLRLARDEDLRRKMAENARRLGRERFERGLLAAKMQRILHEAARR
jgi:glycosyltransferase involved in cell wall biosynthesis